MIGTLAPLLTNTNQHHGTVDDSSFIHSLHIIVQAFKDTETAIELIFF
jgi:hypothetical protein